MIEEIAEKYGEEIVIPAHKPAHQFILCPVGLVGAGKTTVAKPLSEKLSLVRISNDEIRKHLHERGEGYDDVHEIAAIVANNYLEEGYSICFDNDCVGEETQELLEIAENVFGLELVWIHINPPESFILNKLRNLTPNWMSTADKMVENYYQRKPLHEHLDFPFVYTFDTSKQNLPDQINEAAEIIKKKLSISLQ